MEPVRSIYTTIRPLDASDGPGGLIALNATDGSLRWRRDYGQASADPPILSAGTLYQGLGSGELYAIGASDGATIWQATMPGPASPLLHEGTIYVELRGTGGSLGYVVGLDAADGSVTWRSAPGYGSLEVPPVDGNLYLYHMSDRLEVAQVHLRDGAPGWHFGVDGLSLEGDDLPSIWRVTNRHVYVKYASDYEDIALYALEPRDGSVAWRFPGMSVTLRRGEWMVFPIASDEESIYILTNDGQGYVWTSLCALDPTDGAVRWRLELPLLGAGGGMFHGALYLTVGDSDHSDLLAVNPRDGHVRWRRRLGPLVDKLLCMDGDTLYVDSLHTGLFALNALTGATLWHSPCRRVCRRPASPRASCIAPSPSTRTTCRPARITSARSARAIARRCGAMTCRVSSSGRSWRREPLTPGEASSGWQLARFWGDCGRREQGRRVRERMGQRQEPFR